MAPKGASEIIEAVNDKYSDEAELRARFEYDYGLFILKQFKMKETMEIAGVTSSSQWDNYTTNRPRTLAEKLIADLSMARLDIKIPYVFDPKDSRKAKDNGERFLYGAINLVDARRRAQRKRRLQLEKAWHAVVRGQWATRTYIHKNKRNETIIEVDVWDRMHTFYEDGEDGLDWACYTRTIPAAYAKSKYGKEISGKNVKLYDFWDTKSNTILLGTDYIIKEETDHGLDHVPVDICVCGATPYIESEEFPETIMDEGESCYAANRFVYENMNKQRTYRGTMIGLGVHNPFIHYSKGGKQTLKQSPWHRGAEIPADTDKDESFKPLFQPVMPQDAMEFEREISADADMGGLPPIAHGVMSYPAPHSGYQTSTLTGSAASRIYFSQLAVEESFNWDCRELLTQYNKGFKALNLRGHDGTGAPFAVKLSPSEIKGEWFPECKLMVQLPEDEAGKFVMLRDAVMNRIYSRQTARDKLGIQDTDAEEDIIMREMATEDPSVALRLVAKGLIEDGDTELSQILIAKAMIQEQQIKMQLGQMVQNQQKPFQTGLPSNVLPPGQAGQVPMNQEDIRLQQLGMERGY